MEQYEPVPYRINVPSLNLHCSTINNKVEAAVNDGISLSDIIRICNFCSIVPVFPVIHSQMATQLLLQNNLYLVAPLIKLASLMTGEINFEWI